MPLAVSVSVLYKKIVPPPDPHSHINQPQSPSNFNATIIFFGNYQNVNYELWLMARWVSIPTCKSRLETRNSERLGLGLDWWLAIESRLVVIVVSILILRFAIREIRNPRLGFGLGRFNSDLDSGFRIRDLGSLVLVLSIQIQSQIPDSLRFVRIARAYRLSRVGVVSHTGDARFVAECASVFRNWERKRLSTKEKIKVKLVDCHCISAT